MVRLAHIHYVPLRSSLVNLPISIYGPLVERSVRPQHLAVHLSNSTTQAYVGWTGMASAASLAHFSSSSGSSSKTETFETIDIDPQYAAALGFKEGDIVEIGLIHNLKSATAVETEPVSADDWDIVDLHASHVENTLLSQVRCASVGQVVYVWVLGRTRIALKVLSLTPTPTTSNALLLANDTEVSIAPKMHRSKTRSSETNTATKEDPVPEKSTQAPELILRVLPSSLLSSSTSLSLAYVSRDTYRALFPETNGVELKAVTLKALAAPADPSSASENTTPSDPTAIKITPGKEVVKTAEPSEEVVYVRSLDGMPEQHVVFTRTGVCQAWDLISLSENAKEPDAKMDAQITQTSLVHPPTLFQHPVLAGIDGILERCVQFCIRTLVLHRTVDTVRGIPSLLITGRSGSGKTSIAQAVAKFAQDDPRALTYSRHVDLSRHAETPVPTLKTLFNFWLDDAVWHRPSILILDGLDSIVGAEVEHADSFRSRHITELFIATFAGAVNARGIMIIGTASGTAALHSRISSAHVFSEVVPVTTPGKDARRDILRRLVERRVSMARDRVSADALNYTALAAEAEGYSATDLRDLVGRAVHQVAMRVGPNEQPSVITSADFAAAQKGFVPLSLRNVKLEKSEVEWSDIGGLNETRRVLRETLEWPTKYGPIFKQSPLRLRSGLLLYGFPGCGKTLLASAVAKECGLNFISVKGPEILNKYIGASEKSVRDLFERASAAKPCVLFFDEFDSIAPKRGHDSTGVTDRVVNQMLTQMDGAEGLDGVYVLAATSRPDLIDSALLRPGRLDKSLFCNMPDTTERREILQAVSRKVHISPSLDFDKVAELTEGFSGADLQALVYNAHLEVVHAAISAVSDVDLVSSSAKEEAAVEYVVLGSDSKGKGKTKEGTGVIVSKAEEAALQRRLRQIQLATKSKRDGGNSGPGRTKSPIKHEITPEYMNRTLKSTRPSVSAEERERLGRIYRDFVSDRSGEMPTPPNAGGIGNRVSLM